MALSQHTTEDLMHFGRKAYFLYLLHFAYDGATFNTSLSWFFWFKLVVVVLIGKRIYCIIIIYSILTSFRRQAFIVGITIAPFLIDWLYRQLRIHCMIMG